MNDSIPPDDAPIRPRPIAVLEDEHEDAVGRSDRERVEHDRLHRDHDRAEGEQHQHEGQREHEREHIGRPLLELVLEVDRLRRHSSNAGGRVGKVPHRRRHEVVAERVDSGLRGRVGAVTGNRDRDEGDRAGPIDIDLDRPEHLPARERPAAQLPDRGTDSGRADIGSLDDNLCSDRVAGERLLDLVVGPDDGERPWQRLRAALRRLQAERRHGERDQDAGCQDP